MDIHPTPGIRLDTRASSVVTGATNAAVHRSMDDQPQLVTPLSHDNSLSNANATTKNDNFARIVTAIQQGIATSRQMNEIHSVPM
jgi:hypothetical protein